MKARATALGFSDLEAMFAALEEVGKTVDVPPPERTEVQPDAQPNQEPPVTTPAAPSQSSAPPASAPATPAPAAPDPVTPPAPVVAPHVPVQPPMQQPPAQGTQPAGAQGQPTQERGANDRALPDHIRARIQKERDQHTQRYGQLQSQYTAEQARAAQLEQQAQALQEEMRIKVSLAQAGITDIDFGWFELSKELKNLARDTTPEGRAKLEAFDVKAWIDAQRASRPYIFGVQPTPATTGAPAAPNVQPAPPAPGPAQVAGAAGAAGTFNAMNSSPQEFEQRMRQGGFAYAGARPVRRA